MEQLSLTPDQITLQPEAGSQVHTGCFYKVMKDQDRTITLASNLLLVDQYMLHVVPDTY